jgi:hypothetical protein
MSENIPRNELLVVLKINRGKFGISRGRVVDWRGPLQRLGGLLLVL